MLVFRVEGLGLGLGSRMQGSERKGFPRTAKSLADRLLDVARGLRCCCLGSRMNAPGSGIRV